MTHSSAPTARHVFSATTGSTRSRTTVEVMARLASSNDARRATCSCSRRNMSALRMASAAAPQTASDGAQLVLIVAARAPIDELQRAERLTLDHERHHQQADLAALRHRAALLCAEAPVVEVLDRERRARLQGDAGRRPLVRLKLCAIQTWSTSPSSTPARQRSEPSSSTYTLLIGASVISPQSPARGDQHIVEGEGRREEGTRLTHHSEAPGGLAAARRTSPSSPAPGRRCGPGPAADRAGRARGARRS